MKVLRKEVDQQFNIRGFEDLIDANICGLYNITLEELDSIAQNATDEELNDFVPAENLSFAERRRGIEVRNKYVKYFQR